MPLSRLLKYSISIVIIGGISYYGYTKFFMKTATTSRPNIIRVGTGDLSSTIKTTGNINPVQQSTLSFTKQGIVKKIYKKTGDGVQQGDIIAEIDGTSASLELQSAEISLSNAKLNYEKVLSNATDVEKIQSQNTLMESESKLKLLEGAYETLLIEQKNTLLETQENIKLLEGKKELAKSELEYAKKNINTDTTSNNLERDIVSSMIQLEDITRSLSDIRRDFYDITLMADRSNMRYGDLGANDGANKRGVESLFISWSGSIESYNSKMVLLRSQKVASFSETIQKLEEAKSILNDASRLASSILIEIDTSIRGVYYTTTMIENQTTTVKNHANTLSTKLSSINSSLTTLKNYGNDELEALADKNTISQKEQALADAENTLIKAKRNLDTLIKTQASNLTSKQDEMIQMKNSITLNQKKYEELLAGATREELQSAKNAIESAEISRAKAQLSFKDYQIIAPFDGIVEDIPWIVGDTTTSTEGIVIANKNLYEISLSLDQIDIVKIHEGMPSRIVLDAFPNEIFTGTVARISQTPTETSGVVSYTANIQLILPEKSIMSKMSATVTIILSEKKNILTLPTSTIKTEDKKTYVTIRRGKGTNSTSEKREIIIGMSQDGKVEVLSGVMLGDVIESNTFGTSSTIPTSTSTKRSSGGFGGPPGGF